MRNKLEEIQELMNELTKFAPTYIQELGIAEGNPTGFIKCLNPNHNDNNPSMSWYREGELYHCFSCGANYSIFQLASIYEGKPTHGKEFIIQNVFYLAQRYGIPYSHIDIEFTGDDLERMKQFDTMRILEEHVKKNVNHEYLASRKITPATASELSIGSANFKELVKELASIGIDEAFAKKLGIDEFKLNENKLVLIIKDSAGRPVSFVSREMKYQLTKDQKEELKKAVEQHGDFETKEEKSKWLKETFGQEFYRATMTPKYINGVASLIYDKSSIFYGYSAVKKKINRFRYVYVVEG